MVNIENPAYRNEILPSGFLPLKLCLNIFAVFSAPFEYFEEKSQKTPKI